ncbi:MAG: PQQ-binding-like beta-propeller repeat protein [Verrucomicrobiota bacterium]
MIKPLPFLAAVLAVVSSVHAESWWPQFRGPNASGVSESAKPPTVFAPGTNQLWKVSVPSGASSPCIWGNSIYLTAFEDGKLETLCLQRRDGKLLWKADAKTEKIEDFNTAEGSPAASTPVTDGKRVVSYFGSCGLICYDTKGKELWRYSLPTAESAGSFGTGGSPILVDGLVLVSRDQPSACSLLALDLKTGKKVWETGRPDVGPGFGTPIFWKNAGAKEVVMPGSFKLKGYDLKTGEERWSIGGMPSFTCTTPVAGSDMLYFAGWSPGKEAGTGPSWDNMGKPADKDNDGAVTLEEMKAVNMGAFFKALDFNADGKITPDDLASMQAQMAKGENVLVAIKPGGKGELTESQVAWKQTRGLPYVPSPLFYKDCVYIVRDGGMISSYDAKTGTPHYQQERLDAIGNYYASPVAADGRIYVASLNGKVTVLAAGGDMPKILHQADFKERISATPALIGKAIYYRTATALYAFGR